MQPQQKEALMPATPLRSAENELENTIELRANGNRNCSSKTWTSAPKRKNNDFEDIFLWTNQKNCCKISIATLMQPLQYDLWHPAAKDTSIMHAATTAKRIDAATPLRSAEAELENTIELCATAKKNLGPKTKHCKLGSPNAMAQRAQSSLWPLSESTFAKDTVQPHTIACPPRRRQEALYAKKNAGFVRSSINRTKRRSSHSNTNCNKHMGTAQSMSSMTFLKVNFAIEKPREPKIITPSASRTRRTDKVPHIAAETHFMRKETQGIVRSPTFKNYLDSQQLASSQWDCISQDIDHGHVTSHANCNPRSLNSLAQRSWWAHWPSWKSIWKGGSQTRFPTSPPRHFMRKDIEVRAIPNLQ